MISFHTSPSHSRTFCQLTSLLFHALHLACWGVHLACWGARGAWRLRGLQRFVYESILLAIDVRVGWKQISPLRWESSKVAKCTIFLSNTLLLPKAGGGWLCLSREGGGDGNEPWSSGWEPSCTSAAAPAKHNSAFPSVTAPVPTSLSIHCKFTVFSCVKWTDTKCRLHH